MKVVVNRDSCIGCGACESLAPSVFQLDDEGISKVVSNNIENEEDVEEAINSCPTSAISKED